MSEPTITFGVIAGFDEVPNASAQNDDSNVNSPRANTLGPTGNEVAAKLHSERTDVTTNYKANTIGSVTIPSEIGKIVNGLVLTSINIQTTADDYATMTLTGHNHTTNAHADTRPLKSVAHGISLASGFGCTDFLGGTAGDNASPVSSGINITTDHRDEDAGSGNHLIGDNFDPRMEGNTDWVGAPSASAGAGWGEEIGPCCAEVGLSALTDRFLCLRLFRRGRFAKI